MVLETVVDDSGYPGSSVLSLGLGSRDEEVRGDAAGSRVYATPATAPGRRAVEGGREVRQTETLLRSKTVHDKLVEAKAVCKTLVCPDRPRLQVIRVIE